jgi:hypothetical protein
MCGIRAPEIHSPESTSQLSASDCSILGLIQDHIMYLWWIKEQWITFSRSTLVSLPIVTSQNAFDLAYGWCIVPFMA